MSSETILNENKQDVFVFQGCGKYGKELEAIRNTVTKIELFQVDYDSQFNGLMEDNKFPNLTDLSITCTHRNFTITILCPLKRLKLHNIRRFKVSNATQLEELDIRDVSHHSYFQGLSSAPLKCFTFKSSNSRRFPGGLYPLPTSHLIDVHMEGHSFPISDAPLLEQLHIDNRNKSSKIVICSCPKLRKLTLLTSPGQNVHLCDIPLADDVSFKFDDNISVCLDGDVSRVISDFLYKYKEEEKEKEIRKKHLNFYGTLEAVLKGILVYTEEPLEKFPICEEEAWRKENKRLDTMFEKFSLMMPEFLKSKMSRIRLCNVLESICNAKNQSQFMVTEYLKYEKIAKEYLESFRVFSKKVIEEVKIDQEWIKSCYGTLVDAKLLSEIQTRFRKQDQNFTFIVDHWNKARNSIGMLEYIVYDFEPLQLQPEFSILE